MKSEPVRVEVGQELHRGFLLPLSSEQAVRDWSDTTQACNEAGVTIFDDFGPTTDPATSPNPTALESKALRTSYGSHSRSSALQTLYDFCENPNPGSVDYLRTTGSASQIREVQGAMMLCRNWPLTGLVSQYIEAAQTLSRLKRAGKIFGGGTFRVGVRIQPGTYYVTRPGNCYWERSDRNGNIIDNFFSTSAARVQVSILSTDYSFSSRDCGEWRPLGY